MSDDRAAAADPPRRLPGLFVAIACFLLALGCSAHAWLAVRNKSATFDEPIHAFSAWLIVNRGDFRVNPEHPPLWKYVAGLPLIGFPLNVDLNAPAARAMLNITERQWWWGVDTLYRTTGNDGIALVARARMAMALLPMLLALVVARWAWSLGGPVAAVVATLLLTLDPTLLAHGALVTNDVAATLAITLATWLTWRLGRRLSWSAAAAWTIVVAASVGVKFTCVLLAPMLGVPLLLRAILPRMFAKPVPADLTLTNLTSADATGAISTDAFRDTPSDAPRSPMSAITPRHELGLFGRLGATLGLALAAGAVAYLMLWGIYQFRFAPTSDGLTFDAGYARRIDAYYSIQRDAALRGQPMGNLDIRRAVPTYVSSPGVRAIGWLQDHRLIPQAFGHGLIYARGRSQVRPAFLMGEHLAFGSPTYFPLAIAFKTPVTTLAFATAALLLGLPALWRALRRRPAARWATLCLILPPAIYFAAAVGSGLNIGVRHVLPLLPPACVGIGVACAVAIRHRRRVALLVGAGLLTLAMEVAWAFPNYLTFFNAPSGGARGGLTLLSDSNLDWGQDLPALAEWYRGWRQANPGRTFFLSYFGTVDPHAYGIDYVNTVPGYSFATEPPQRDLLRPGGGVFAVSASSLQGTFDTATRELMAAFRVAEPLDVINGTIYLYDLPDPTAGTAPKAPPTGWNLPR